MKTLALIVLFSALGGVVVAVLAWLLVLASDEVYRWVRKGGRR